MKHTYALRNRVNGPDGVKQRHVVSLNETWSVEGSVASMRTGKWRVVSRRGMVREVRRERIYNSS